MKSLVNHFVDIAETIFDISSKPFLFDVTSPSLL